MKNLVGLLSGLIFGFGLALSGMTDTNKVLGFLDIFGSWQPALAFVMGSAVAVTLIGYRLVMRRMRLPFGIPFHLTQTGLLDRRLLLGSALFGVGWGLYGFCPGPALSGLIFGQSDTVFFVLAMMAGMGVASRVMPAQN